MSTVSVLRQLGFDRSGSSRPGSHSIWPASCGMQLIDFRMVQHRAARIQPPTTADLGRSEKTWRGQADKGSGGLPMIDWANETLMSL
jgi:hypothetical protein